MEGAHGVLPVLLLDDVMSELDRERRTMLVELLAESGQTLITTADEGALPMDIGVTVRLGRPTASATPESAG